MGSEFAPVSAPVSLDSLKALLDAANEQADRRKHAR